jgi:hypothetical protein
MSFQFPPTQKDPRGAPVYADTGSSVDLKLPPNKKAKRGAQAGSPAQGSATSGSPQVTKTPAPSKQATMGAQTMDVKMDQSMKPFKCDQGCELGFSSADQLNLHIKQMHAVPVDPLQYATENLAEVLGLNPDGTRKAQPNGKGAAGKSDKAMASPPKPGQKGAAGQKKGVKTSPAVANLKNPQQSKAPAPTSAPKTGAKTDDAGAENEDSWANANITPSELYDTFKPMDNFTLDWVLKTSLNSSPSALTPSSSSTRDSASSHSRDSDIAEVDNINVTIAVDNPEFDQVDSTLIYLNDWNMENTDILETDPALLEELGIEPPKTSTKKSPTANNEVNPRWGGATGPIPASAPLISDFFKEQEDGQLAMNVSEWENMFSDGRGLASEQPNPEGLYDISDMLGMQL